MEEGDSTTRRGEPVQCTVLGERIPARLRALLEQRGWRGRAVSDPVIAMIEIARHERAERARCGWGAGRKDASALIVPGGGPDRDGHQGRDGDIEALCAAVARYLPEVIVLSHRDGRLEPRQRGAEFAADLTPGHLVDVEEVDVEEDDESLETQSGGDSRNGSDDETDRADRTTLSRAEIDMLLNFSAGESSS